MSDESENADDDGTEARGSLGAAGDPGDVRPRASSFVTPGFGNIDTGTSRVLRALSDTQAQMGRYFSRAVAVSGAFSSLERARASVLTSVQIPALTLMEGLARASTGPSMLAGTLATQAADARLAGLASLSSRAFSALHENEFARLAKTSRLLEQQTAALAAIGPSLEISRPVSFATQAWREVVETTTADADGVFLGRLQMTARGTAGAIEAGILLSEPDDGERDRFETETWIARGTAEVSTDLRARLRSLHPTLQDRLDGAWERIRDGGADATGQAANSLMEVIDWTLRLLAPDREVIEWHAMEQRPLSELHDGRPTRSLA